MSAAVRAVLLILWMQVLNQMSEALYASKKNVCSSTNVLVLGAGMAGIAAAKTLSDNGTTDFVILEARSNIGGRVWSEVLTNSGVRIELGANWIQGIDPEQPNLHPLWQKVQRCGGIGGSFMKTLTKSLLFTYNEKGENITNDVNFTKRLAEWNNVTFPKLNELAENQSKRGLADISLRKGLELVNWIPRDANDKAIEWMGLDDCIAEQPERSSLQETLPDTTYSSFGNSNRTQNYFVTDQEHGFVKVIECIASEFLRPDDERLHLGSNVSEIHWSTDEVCVNTLESSDEVCYCAPFAILTFSIGAIKFNSDLKFLPPLPTWKNDALAKAAMALYLKIFLEFNYTFWDTDADFIVHTDDRRGYFINFQSIYIPGKPSILFATVTGDEARLVYNQTVQKTTNAIMTILKTIYGDSIPDPIQVTFPNFARDPLYYGMYSYPAFGITNETLELLGAPVGRLYFSGEATSLEYSGFVHGAYFSGVHTANDILKANKTGMTSASAGKTSKLIWLLLTFAVLLVVC